jgi:pimeloyl-ACP methyl ester carboxylesterase
MPAERFFSSAMRFPSLARRGWATLLAAVALTPCWALAAPAGAPPGGKSAKEKTIPESEPLTLPTFDGLQLALTYYPGTEGKKSIPVVLLHMWKQNGNDYRDLALALQKMGCAVIVPDLRGHGGSKRLKGLRQEETLKAATLAPEQFRRMVTQDMEAVKKFLWQRNNDGELNIDKLCVVGAEMGASVALNFALADAAVQDMNRVYGADRERKVGRFVKALVLLSPEHSFRGLPIRAAAAPLISNVAMLILVGKQDAKALDEAKRIHGIFERYHPEPTGDDKTDKRTLFYGKLDTSLQGTKLLDPKFNVPAMIADFIYLRLIKSEESRDWTWQARKLPHG